MTTEMNEAAILSVTILIGIVYTFFNVVTIIVILFDRKLRRHPTNYPILSFLAGSALQGMLPAPLYLYKILKHRSGAKVPGWMCDTYRFPYIFCGHIMELSIMLISFDRLIAVKFPFIYPKKVTRLSSGLVLIFGWILTISVDVLPFSLGTSKNDDCHYVPTKTWGLIVIIFYNMLPFVVVVVNYSIIWNVAREFAIHDRNRTLSVTSSRQKERQNKHSKLKFMFEMKATKTSLVIVSVYLVCWIPMGVFFMVDHFCSNCLSDMERLKPARRAVKILAFTSSLVAPVIYCWWNKGFRKAANRISRSTIKSSRLLRSTYTISSESSNL